jgi:hypothetical protein
MRINDQFWQYAREALLLANEAKTDEDRESFLDLARTWIDAAIVEQHALANRDKQIAA